MSTITPAGNPQSQPTPATLVTASSAGIAKGPQGFQFSAALVSNASPWVVAISGLEGTKTLQPYTADLIHPPAAGLPYAYAVPPGGSATAPPGAATYQQIDWFVAGGGDPQGTFPIALTSLAVAAAIAGSIFLPQDLILNSQIVNIPGGVTPGSFLITPPDGIESVSIWLQYQSGGPAGDQSLTVENTEFVPDGTATGVTLGTITNNNLVVLDVVSNLSNTFEVFAPTGPEQITVTVIGWPYPAKMVGTGRSLVQPDFVELAAVAAGVTVPVLGPAGQPVMAGPVVKDSANGVSVVVSATNAQLIPAPAAGQRIVIDSVTLVNTTTTASDLKLLHNGNTGTLFWWVNNPAGSTAGFPLLGPIYGQNGKNVWCSSSGTGGVRFSAAYHLEYVSTQ